jgi:uncharacterized protein
MTPTEAFRIAQERLHRFSASIDPRLLEAEDSAPTVLARLNASRGTKLRKIYRLLDELSTAAKPYVACAKGCSACCHMNVTISTLEAKRIEAVTGTRGTAPTESRHHPSTRFSGVPCPFLKESVCSIYADRPFACRQHHSFDLSDYWCKPERSQMQAMPLIRFEGLETAYRELTVASPGDLFADIRDFFPALT